MSFREVPCQSCSMFLMSHLLTQHLGLTRVVDRILCVHSNSVAQCRHDFKVIIRLQMLNVYIACVHPFAQPLNLENEAFDHCENLRKLAYIICSMFNVFTCLARQTVCHAQF